MSDWTKFTKRITVNASKEDIYKAWATQAGIERWFLRSSEFTTPNGEVRNQNDFAQKDDKYFWKWHGWSDEANQGGDVVKANGVDFFQFTFHDPMVVSIKILNENGANVVELTQENIPTDDDSRKNYFVGCSEGWTFYLANLKSILEGGIDLRNKDENIKSVVNA